MGLAAIVTIAAALGMAVTLPQRIDPMLEESRELDRYCVAAAAGLPLCYRLDANGQWLEAAQQSAGQWVAVRTVADPAFSAGCVTRGEGVGDPPFSLAFRCS